MPYLPVDDPAQGACRLTAYILRKVKAGGGRAVADRSNPTQGLQKIFS